MDGDYGERWTWVKWMPVFFITTTATPWLDKKPTIFWRAIAGLGVMHTIENAKANKTDKLFEDIKIINIDIQ